MRLFLDSSVLLAGCGRHTGASHFILKHARQAGWRLFVSTYVVTEVEANLAALGTTAVATWRTFAASIEVVPDVLNIPWPVVFAVPKDRPILFTAVAYADVLLTLDRRDFMDLLGQEFYGLPILKPGTFLANERERGTVSF